MATTRLLRISSTPALPNERIISPTVSRPMTLLMCLNKAGLSADNPPARGDALAAVKAAGSTPVLVSERETEKGVDLGLLLAYVVDVLSRWKKKIATQQIRPWRFFYVQMFMEKAIVDCRFFSLLAITGSLLGSVLCFVEGCFLIVVSYLQYQLRPLSKMSTEQAQVVLQIIEAIDMFLMGTAMLVFAMALHVMFVGRDHSCRNINLIKGVPSWMQVESAMQAKSKMGHALIMILQIQVLDKSKSIVVSNGLDLAYFAATIFLSSASIFLLSRTTSKKPPSPSPAKR